MGSVHEHDTARAQRPERDTRGTERAGWVGSGSGLTSELVTMPCAGSSSEGMPPSSSSPPPIPAQCNQHTPIEFT